MVAYLYLCHLARMNDSSITYEAVASPFDRRLFSPKGPFGRPRCIALPPREMTISKLLGCWSLEFVRSFQLQILSVPFLVRCLTEVRASSLANRDSTASPSTEWLTLLISRPCTTTVPQNPQLANPTRDLKLSISRRLSFASFASPRPV